MSSDGSYGSTRFSQAYTSFPGLFFTLMFDHFLQPMTDLPKYLKKHGAVEPTSFYCNPYSDYHNASDSGITTWEIMSKDPDKLKTFQIGLTVGDAMVPVTGYYDFNQLALTPEELQQDPGRVSLVDIGGGVGNVLKRILDVYKDLHPKHVVLQDQENIIAMAEKEKIAPDGVRLMKHDFWGPQPVKGMYSEPTPTGLEWPNWNWYHLWMGINISLPLLSCDQDHLILPTTTLAL